MQKVIFFYEKLKAQIFGRVIIKEPCSPLSTSVSKVMLQLL